MTRKYSSISVETTLAINISNSATTMTVASSTGSALMGGVTLAVGNVDTFAVALDPDTVNEEIVFITQQSSDTFTIVRGQAGSSAISHTGGAVVRHVVTSLDFTAFESTTQNAVTLTGTQSLTNKNLTDGSNTFPTSLATLTGSQTLTNKTINSSKFNYSLNAQTGTTYTLVAGDQDKIVTLSNAAAITVTVPNGVFSPGNVINLLQLGAGQVTVASDGTTVINPTSLKIGGQYGMASLVCVASNTFVLAGNTTA